MSTDPKDPRTEPTPVTDSEAPAQHPHDDHKVAANPPCTDGPDDANEIDDPHYQAEESGE